MVSVESQLSPTEILPSGRLLRHREGLRLGHSGRQDRAFISITCER